MKKEFEITINYDQALEILVHLLDAEEKYKKELENDNVGNYEKTFINQSLRNIAKIKSQLNKRL